MFMRTMQSLALACLFFGSLSAAEDPFVGKWKLNQDKSKITGLQERIEALSGNKYKITFGEVSDTIVADGTDQPIHFGRTMALKKQDANTWTSTTKKDGKVLGTSTWVVSEDDKSLKVTTTGTRPNGEDFKDEIVHKRVSGGPGIAGTWETTEFKIGSPEEWDIQPYESNGLSFITPAEKDTLNIKFDGKEYSEQGPNVAEGSTSSGRRIDSRTLEITDKIKGKVMDTVEFKLSPDDKTLTLTIHVRGEKKPVTVVYDRAA
jgi:hypothetical protein